MQKTKGGFTNTLGAMLNNSITGSIINKIFS